MVAGHAQGRAVRDHVHDQPQNIRRRRPAVAQVAQKNSLSSGGRSDRASGTDSWKLVSQLRQEFDQFVVAPVNVTNDVERARIGLAIVPQGLPFNGYVGGFRRRCQNKKVPKNIALETTK